MPSVLVTAGNKHSPTFENVCYAVAKILGSMDVVHIFDTEESEASANKEGRSLTIRNIFGAATDIRTSRVNEYDLQTVIPTRISKLIEEFGSEQLIVDLTNGRKITASVLYAVAAIARVEHIYSLEMKVNPRTLPEEVRLPDLDHPGDWEYVGVETLKEINYIARSSQLELIYYRDRIDQACNSIGRREKGLAKDLRRSLNNALIHYFAASVNGETLIANIERLEDCIGSLGKICETVAMLVYARYQQADNSSKAARNFRTRVNTLMSVWEWGHMKLSGRATSKEYALEEDFIQAVIKPSLTLGAILQSAVLYRNLVMHSGQHYFLTIDDARFVLAATLLLLEQLGRSDIIPEAD